MRRLHTECPHTVAQNSIISWPSRTTLPQNSNWCQYSRTALTIVNHRGMKTYIRELKRFLTFIHVDRARPEVNMGLHNGHLNALCQCIKWLAHKTQRGNKVEHVLQIPAWTRMCVSTTDSHVLFAIQAAISVQTPARLTKCKTKRTETLFNWNSTLNCIKCHSTYIFIHNFITHYAITWSINVPCPFTLLLFTEEVQQPGWNKHPVIYWKSC